MICQTRSISTICCHSMRSTCVCVYCYLSLMFNSVFSVHREQRTGDCLRANSPFIVVQALTGGWLLLGCCYYIHELVSSAPLFWFGNTFPTIDEFRLKLGIFKRTTWVDGWESWYHCPNKNWNRHITTKDLPCNVSKESRRPVSNVEELIYPTPLIVFSCRSLYIAFP